MINTTLDCVDAERQREIKSSQFAEQALEKARDHIYEAFVVTYQDRLLRALAATAEHGHTVTLTVIPTVGFCFRHRTFRQSIILPIGVPDRSVYTIHQMNLYFVEQALLSR